MFYFDFDSLSYQIDYHNVNNEIITKNGRFTKFSFVN